MQIEQFQKVEIKLLFTTNKVECAKQRYKYIVPGSDKSRSEIRFFCIK